MQFTKQFLKFISTQVRYMVTANTPKNHYESLGITPKSTQGEIKSAYYKLSMIYHPDKNRDEASHQKFRDINEAYEVLGNVKTRKLYDRGLYFRPGIEIDKPENKFHKSRESRSKPPPPDGNNPIYDFDEWAKSHYGNTFKRQMENKKRAQEYRDSRQNEHTNKKLEAVVFIMTALVLICMTCGRDKYQDYDTVNFGVHGILVARKTSDNDPKDDK